MRNAKEIEELIKRAIRDELAFNPLKSVAQIRLSFFKQGYQQVYGKLDWHHVSKLVKQVHIKNIASLYFKDRGEQFSIIKERHRVITQKLVGIIEGEASNSLQQVELPNAHRTHCCSKHDIEMGHGIFLYRGASQSNRNGRAERKCPTQSAPSGVRDTVKSFCF